MAKPARNGQLWTKTEEDSILACIQAGMTIAQIAEDKQRTTGGIRSRLTRIACCFVEETKMTIYEASGRTGIRVARIQEMLKRKTEQEAAKVVCPTKMEFTFQQTTSREELRGLPHKHKMACLQNIAEQPAQSIQGLATRGETSYLWEMDEAKLPHFLVQRGCGHLKLTLEEVMGALRARYPGCTVSLSEEWVDVPTKFAPQAPMRTLKSGIKIDWS
jgi:hypothetical protein